VYCSHSISPAFPSSFPQSSYRTSTAYCACLLPVPGRAKNGQNWLESALKSILRPVSYLFDINLNIVELVS
jgi:hypothetical protein